MIFEPLFEYMKNPLRITFEDDIIDISYNIIKNTGRITECLKKLFPTLPKCIEKNGFFSKQCFMLINQYIIIDNDPKDGMNKNTFFGNYLYQKIVIINHININN